MHTSMHECIYIASINAIDLCIVTYICFIHQCKYQSIHMYILNQSIQYIYASMHRLMDIFMDRYMYVTMHGFIVLINEIDLCIYVCINWYMQ